MDREAREQTKREREREREREKGKLVRYEYQSGLINYPATPASQPRDKQHACDEPIIKIEQEDPPW